MKCAIMQPTYCPWAGYFNLIAKSNYFVFLDDAQFQKSSWHNRNRLIVNGEPRWFTVPIVREFLGQAICEVKTDDRSTWRRKHYELIKHNYQKCEYFECIQPILKIILDQSIKTLSELNISIIKEICSIIGLETNFILSSNLKAKGERTQKIINICKILECDEYISPPGAKEYIENDNFIEITDIKLIFNEFMPKFYLQKNTNKFEGYLSILDALANIGVSETYKYISLATDYAGDVA